MIKSVIIVEDETAAVVNLRSMLSIVAPGAEVVEVLESVEEAVEFFKGEVEADVVFMDIHLADGDSFRIFDSVDIEIPIIFTTAYDQYALEAFKVNSIDYLLKPFDYNEFSKAIAKVASLVDLVERCHAAGSAMAQNEAESSDKEFISVKADYKTQLVKIADIVYLESAGEYVRLHLTDGTTLVTLFRLKNMESALPSDKFMRVHRSYIVNLGHVTGYSRSRVMLDNGEYVPISVNYRDAFREYVSRSMPAMQM